MHKRQSTKIFIKFFTQHLRALLNSISQLSRAPLMTLITCTVIGITLALPTSLFILLKNIQSLANYFRQNTEITLYLKSEINAKQATSLASALKTNSSIQSVTIISPAQGLKELLPLNTGDNVLSDLPTNPLPWVLVITPRQAFPSTEALTLLSNKLKQNPEVDFVQMDALWIERLYTLINLFHRTIDGLAIFLVIGILLIINNAILFATQHNRKEIELIKLLGGAPSFIRRPFLYAGAIYGLLGSIIAWQLVDLLLLWLHQPITHLVTLYNSQFKPSEIGILYSIILLCSGISLGLIGSWFTVNAFLRRSQP